MPQVTPAVHYTDSHAFAGDLPAAFRLAEAALTGIGFRIGERTPTAVEFTGPGLNSTKQSPLLGATRIAVWQSGGELHIEAELGGVVRLSRFVSLFPLALVLGLGVVLSVVFSLTFSTGAWLIPVVLAVGVNTVAWLVLGPLIARKIAGRTNQALDTLFHNLLTVGEPAA